ncbi:phospholipase D3 [Galendromus occidentalis]|uniref:Phospholipase D3 n=1 Tax=Galendromus occidentalis TaxID=34638 RepID=A0AAJ6QWG8_9ACAR|nr:phospholipase D3 [Galendromus occidentalis]
MFGATAVAVVIAAAVVAVSAIDSCEFAFVESMPEGLEFPPDSPLHPKTHQVWLDLTLGAEKSIDIASFYWTLRDEDVPPGDNSSWMGEQVFSALMNTGLKKEMKIRIAQNKPSRINPAKDTELFVKAGAAEVRTLDFDKILGAGVLHTKFWIVDDMHVYIGSANMDYRALSQVKELGAVIHNCPTLAADLKKVFEVYWTLGENNRLPDSWPSSLETHFNAKTPLPVNLNSSAAQVYISSSPPAFSPAGRADDLESIVAAIDAANEFVYVAVMDFIPQMLYSGPQKGKLWLPLESALRRAAIERGVEVRLMISEWQSTRESVRAFAASLGELGHAFKIQTRKFVVPKLPPNRVVPFSRVNHNKYLVTDQQAFIGTSNWSGDYFVNTAGVGLHVFHRQIILQLKAIFLRDWESQYTHRIYENRR